MLLIANSQNILATYLSGAPVPNITPTSAKQTTAMDFNYIEDTVCWVHVGDSASQTILKCAKIPNLKGFVEERSINISLSLHRELLPGLCGSSCAVFLLPAHLALAFPPFPSLWLLLVSPAVSLCKHTEKNGRHLGLFSFPLFLLAPCSSCLSPHPEQCLRESQPQICSVRL